MWSVLFNQKYVSVTSASTHVFACFRFFTAFSPASFPVVLGDFGCDVTCQACRENSPRTPRAIALGSKPPLATRIARTGLGTRLLFPL